MISLFCQNLTHVLCLGAHADDIEIGCGATILSWLRRHPKLKVTWVVWSAEGTRRREAEESAQAFLANASSSSIQIETFRDAYFPAHWAQIKQRFDVLADSVSPQIVFTHRMDDRHQDHRVISELTWNSFRNHLIFEYEIPKYEGDLGQPNTYFPVADTEAAFKLDLLRKHFISQATKDWFSDSAFEALLRLRGLECRSPSGLAEAFYSRKLTFDVGS